jgi:hypothetical protein
MPLAGFGPFEDATGFGGSNAFSGSTRFPAWYTGRMLAPSPGLEPPPRRPHTRRSLWGDWWMLVAVLLAIVAGMSVVLVLDLTAK